MLDHLLQRFRPFVEAVVVVAHPSFVAEVRDHLRTSGSLPFDIAVQDQPTGVLDAILLAAPCVDRDVFDRVWLAWCDQICVLPDTLVRIAKAEIAEMASLVFPSSGDADIGVFSLSMTAYADRLPEYAATAAVEASAEERDFLPFIPWLAARETVTPVVCVDPHEGMGIDTPEDLAAVESWLQQRSATS